MDDPRYLINIRIKLGLLVALQLVVWLIVLIKSVRCFNEMSLFDAF